MVGKSFIFVCRIRNAQEYVRVQVTNFDTSKFCYRILSRIISFAVCLEVFGTQAYIPDYGPT